MQRRVVMRLQVYDIGTWTFKGISGAHPVVVLMPSRLAARMSLAPVKKSSKAVCVQPAEGLLHELWVEVVNMDTILLDPELLLSAGIGAYGQQQSGAGASVHAGTSTATSLAGSGRIAPDAVAAVAAVADDGDAGSGGDGGGRHPAGP